MVIKKKVAIVSVLCAGDFICVSTNGKACVDGCPEHTASDQL